MAKRRGRARRRRRMAWALAVAGAAGLVAVVVSWSRIWSYLLAAVLIGGLGTPVRAGWRVHRRERAGDRQWREEDRILENNRSLASVDVLPGIPFEKLVAARLREDGCTEVEWVGRSGDNGRDVAGRLPDGRSMVVQCKRFDPRYPVRAADMQRLLGARTHFGGDVALFVTNTRFTAPARDFAVDNDIVIVHRDLLAPWLKGAPLSSLIDLSGAGQGDRRHLKTWQQTYGTPKRRNSRRRPRSAED